MSHANGHRHADVCLLPCRITGTTLKWLRQKPHVPPECKDSTVSVLKSAICILRPNFHWDRIGIEACLLSRQMCSMKRYWHWQEDDGSDSSISICSYAYCAAAATTVLTSSMDKSSRSNNSTRLGIGSITPPNAFDTSWPLRQFPSAFSYLGRSRTMKGAGYISKWTGVSNV